MIEDVEAPARALGSDRKARLRAAQLGRCLAASYWAWSSRLAVPAFFLIDSIVASADRFSL